MPNTAIQDEFTHLPTAAQRYQARRIKKGMCLRCKNRAVKGKYYCKRCARKLSLCSALNAARRKQKITY